MALEFVKSNRGNELLSYKGFLYHLERSSDTGKKAWSFKRKGRIHTQEGHIIPGTEKDHNHAPDAAQAEAQRVLNQVKDRASTSMARPRNILQV
jgi:hypothetical protein